MHSISARGILPGVPSSISNIRLGRAADIEEIVAFDDVARSTPSRCEFVRRSLGGGCCHVAEAGGKVVAYGVIERNFFGYDFIPILYVAPAWRLRGVGREVMVHLERHCTTPKLFTSANQSNAAMRRLLLGLGYLPSGVVENLDAGDPELVFVKPMTADPETARATQPSRA